MIHFITGDRSMNPILAISAVSLFMLKSLHDDPSATFATGDNPGVEGAVALVALTTGIDVLVVTSPRDASGKIDWDARHAAVLADPTTKITFLHTDPLTSHVGASLATFDTDRVDFATPPVA